VMSETEEQICVPCGAIRNEVFAQAVGKGYELRTLICPQCKSLLRFVSERRAVQRGNPSSSG
jgi:hypothetical protein